MYRMRFYKDSYKAGSKANLHGQHSLIYVLDGKVKVNGEVFDGDIEEDVILEEPYHPAAGHCAVYADGSAAIEALEDSVVWRWEIDRTEAPINIANGEGITSEMTMARPVESYKLVAGRECLLAMDCVIYSGCTEHHTNEATGIRVVRSGAMSCRSKWGEDADCTSPGDAWYEEASYPVYDYTPEGGQVAMMRGLITTSDYAGKGIGSYNLDNMTVHHPGRATWVPYLEQVVTLK